MAPPESAPPPRFPWVRPLAIVNVIWLIVGLALTMSGTMLAVLGYFVLPHLFLATIHPVPTLIAAVVVAAVVVAGAAITGRATRTIGYRIWAFGTLALSVSLAAGIIAVTIMWSSVGS